MRRRRGALHSEDQEQYIKLSILSEKNIGIFYNQNSVQSNTQLATESLWDKFDYNKQEKMMIEEMEQEEMEKGKVITFNVMVLYSNVEGLANFIKNSFSKALELPKIDLEGNSHLDLIMKSEKVKDIKLVVKFWLTTLDYNTMLEPYYKRAQMFILLGGEEDQKPLYQAIETVRTIKGEKHYDQKLLKAAESNQKELIQEIRKVWTCMKMCVSR